MKNRKTMTILSLACTAFLLTACGHKGNIKENASSSVKVEKSTKISKSSSMTKSSSKDKMTTGKTSTETKASTSDKMDKTQTPDSSSSQTPASSQATTQTNGSSQTGQANVQTSIDVTSLSNGDFSSIEGNWLDDLGNNLTVYANGQASFSFNQFDASKGVSQGQVVFQQIVGGVYFGRANDTPFIVIPAGVANTHDGSIANLDRVLIGSTGLADDHPYVR